MYVLKSGTIKYMKNHGMKGSHLLSSTHIFLVAKCMLKPLVHIILIIVLITKKHVYTPLLEKKEMTTLNQ